MYKRTDKLAFLAKKSVEGDTTYYRMTNFTEFTQSKNAKEYTRHYIDEDNERTSVVGYSPSFSYNFDLESDNAVHKIIAEITDGELIGTAANVSIVIVDLNKSSGDTGNFEAVERPVTLIPDSEGDSTDAYTYSGTLKADGEKTFGTATTTDGWKTCTFTALAE